jgi:type IV pilus assembly protein PilV
MYCPENNREAGISLIEVMVAMIVMGIGLIGIAPLMVLSLEANDISKDVTVASNLARDKVEYLEGLDSIPESMYAQNETNVYTTYEKSDGSVIADEMVIGFNRMTVIQDSTTDSLIPAGLLKVTVGISWMDDAGMSRQTAVSTYIKGK